MKQSHFRFYETDQPTLPMNERIHVELPADVYTLDELERLVGELQSYGQKMSLLETPSVGSTQ